jgi:uncharacterized RDD family membrane protein YckC
VGANQSEEVKSQGVALAISLFALFIAPLYFALLQQYWNGQTVGKRLVNIRVRDVGRDRLALGQALGRSYLPTLAVFLFWIPLLIDLLWPLTNVRRQALHDRAANTVVVRR